MSKPDETERLEEEADAADQDSSVIDYVMATSESPAADDIAGAVELDSFQAKEIRTIFFTTLPEYLEPVEQMIEQLLDPAGAAPEVRDPLCATLSSISQAAARIGIDEVPALLDRMRGRIAPMGPEPASRELVQERFDGGSPPVRALARRRQEHATEIARAVASEQRDELIFLELDHVVRARVVDDEQAPAAGDAMMTQEAVRREPRSIREGHGHTVDSQRAAPSRSSGWGSPSRIASTCLASSGHGA